MESYDKSVELKLVTWQYHEYGVWKNFEDNPSCKGDNVVLEQGFQAGRKTLTLIHGWYETVRSFSLSLSLSHTLTTHTHTVRYQFHQENVTKETNERIQENQKMGRVYEKATSRKVHEREERSFSEKEQVSGEEVLGKV